MNGANILRKRYTKTTGARSKWEASGFDVGAVEPLLPVTGLYEKTPKAFRDKLIKIGAELGMNPNYIAGIISLESAFDPSIVNPLTHKHGGLIGFSTDTAIMLGTTLDKLLAMTATEQLDYVKKFFDHYPPGSEKLTTPTRAYMACFMPEHVFKPADFAIASVGDIVYTQNPGLDQNHDGKITPSDVGGILEHVLANAAKKPQPNETPNTSTNTTSGASFVLLLAMIAVGATAGSAALKRKAP